MFYTCVVQYIMRFFLLAALKHHTSKLREFSDLTSVSSFGFRGEALSSLCALSHLSVVTRTSEAAAACAVAYDSSGAISARRREARAVGTTVVLEELFHSLPVRRKEFVRNAKREFAKLVHLVQAYCLVAKGVR